METTMMVDCRRIETLYIISLSFYLPLFYSQSSPILYLALHRSKVYATIYLWLLEFGLDIQIKYMMFTSGNILLFTITSKKTVIAVILCLSLQMIQCKCPDATLCKSLLRTVISLSSLKAIWFYSSGVEVFQWTYFVCQHIPQCCVLSPLSTPC